jgi:hypothetical protein
MTVNEFANFIVRNKCIGDPAKFYDPTTNTNLYYYVGSKIIESVVSYETICIIPLSEYKELSSTFDCLYYNLTRLQQQNWHVLFSCDESAQIYKPHIIT